MHPPRILGAGAQRFAERRGPLARGGSVAPVDGRRRRFADAWHEPWRLRRAEVLEVDDELVAAAGLPRPTDEPIAHWSEGVDVRIGRPQQPAPEG